MGKIKQLTRTEAIEAMLNPFEDHVVYGLVELDFDITLRELDSIGAFVEIEDEEEAEEPKAVENDPLPEEETPAEDTETRPAKKNGRKTIKLDMGKVKALRNAG